MHKNMSILVRTIGREKIAEFNNNFDEYYDKYSKKAREMGYEGNLRFRKERGMVVVLHPTRIPPILTGVSVRVPVFGSGVVLSMARRWSSSVPPSAPIDDPPTPGAGDAEEAKGTTMPTGVSPETGVVDCAVKATGADVRPGSKVRCAPHCWHVVSDGPTGMVHSQHFPK